MAENEEPRIDSGIARIRFWRMSFLIVAGAYIPAVSILYFLDVSPRALLPVAALLVLAAVILELIIGFTRCPRCRSHFHVSGLRGNLLTRKCMNCGLPLKSAGDGS